MYTNASSRSNDPHHLCECSLLIEMADGTFRQHRIESFVWEWQIVSVGLQELDVELRLFRFLDAPLDHERRAVYSGYLRTEFSGEEAGRTAQPAPAWGETGRVTEHGPPPNLPS